MIRVNKSSCVAWGYEEMVSVPPNGYLFDDAASPGISPPNIAGFPTPD
jgi:hypothetical protein